MEPWITTFTRKRVNPLKLRPEDIDIRDIAHHLACQTRWLGATHRPITTAQHSVYVARLCEGATCELQALLHDAPEAYLGDISKWVKESKQFKFYREIELEAWYIICEAFDLNPTLSSAVVYADRVMAAFEALKGFGPDWDGFKVNGYERPDKVQLEKIGKWGFWTWKQSEELFLQRYKELKNQLEFSA